MNTRQQPVLRPTQSGLDGLRGKETAPPCRRCSTSNLIGLGKGIGLEGRKNMGRKAEPPRRRGLGINTAIKTTRLNHRETALPRRAASFQLT